MPKMNTEGGEHNARGANVDKVEKKKKKKMHNKVCSFVDKYEEMTKKLLDHLQLSNCSTIRTYLTTKEQW